MVAIAGAIAACDSPTPPGACSGDIQVGVDQHALGAAFPVFAWSPHCGVTDIVVTTVGGPEAAEQVLWYVTAAEGTTVASVVTYGATPAHSTTRTGPQPLRAGLQYRVTVQTVVGGDAVAASGEALFRR